MKPSEEVKHLPSLFRQLKMMGGESQQLELIERIREKVIFTLKQIAPPEAALNNSDYASFFCREGLANPERALFHNDLTLLWTCNRILASGKVDQNEINEIIALYGVSDKAKETQEIIHDTGKKTGGTGGKKSGIVRQEKAKTIHEIWQAEADKTWKKHPTWGKPAVGKRIADDIGGKAGYIRKKIEKPLP
jgi:hypothetical protein